MRDGPSRTAEAVCLFRALEQLAPPAQRIVDDPLARLFLGPMMRAALATIAATGRVTEPLNYAPGLVNSVLARHRYFDDLMKSALIGRRVEQVLLLGAGYDTRAYRMSKELGDVVVFELDHPFTAKRKAGMVANHASSLPNANIRPIEIDFQKHSLAERLYASGFQTGACTFVIWEGVSMYLTRNAVKATLRTIREVTGPGSQLAMDFWYLLDTPDAVSTVRRMSTGLLHVLGEPVTFGIHPEDTPQFLEKLGWETLEILVVEDLERRFTYQRSAYPALFVTNLGRI